MTEKGGKKKIAELLLEMYLLTVIVCTFSIDNYWDGENMQSDRTTLVVLLLLPLLLLLILLYIKL